MKMRRKGKDIPSAIHFLRELNRTIHRYYPGVLCIAEEMKGSVDSTQETLRRSLVAEPIKT